MTLAGRRTRRSRPRGKALAEERPAAEVRSGGLPPLGVSTSTRIVPGGADPVPPGGGGGQHGVFRGPTSLPLKPPRPSTSGRAVAGICHLVIIVTTLCPTRVCSGADGGARLRPLAERQRDHERRAVDAVFRALPVVVLPGYRRPLILVADYLALLERSSYDGSRVR